MGNVNEAGAGVLDPEIWVRLAPVIFPGMDETNQGGIPFCKAVLSVSVCLFV